MSYNFNINNSDSLDIIRQKADIAIRELTREKYEILLNFMNSILTTQIESFVKFKNFNLDGIFKNHEKIKNAYTEHSEIIFKKFKIQFSTDDITVKTFVTNFNKCLKVVGRKFKKTHYDTKILYTVICADQ